MKIKWLHFEAIWHKGAPVVSGGVLDLPKAQAQGFIDSGKAAALVVEPAVVKAPDPSEEPEMPIPPVIEDTALTEESDANVKGK